MYVEKIVCCGTKQLIEHVKKEFLCGIPKKAFIVASLYTFSSFTSIYRWYMWPHDMNFISLALFIHSLVLIGN